MLRHRRPTGVLSGLLRALCSRVCSFLPPKQKKRNTPRNFKIQRLLRNAFSERSKRSEKKRDEGVCTGYLAHVPRYVPFYMQNSKGIPPGIRHKTPYLERLFRTPDLRARVSLGVSDGVSPKIGVSDGVSGGGPRCPKSVPRVSPECPGHLFDTLGTLFGHSGTLGPKGLGDTPPPHTPSETPICGVSNRIFKCTLPLRA